MTGKKTCVKAKPLPKGTKTAYKGSFQNRLMERQIRGMPTPKVGMGMTESMWSDRHPYQIVRVSADKRTVWVKPLIVRGPWRNGYGIVTDEVDTRACEREVKLTQRGWQSHGTNFIIGKTMHFEDPGF